MQEGEELLTSVANIESVRTAKGNVEVRSGSYFALPYYVESFVDAMAFGKFVKAVEAAVRKSDDYKHYVGYLRNEVGLDRCSFLGNVRGDDAELEFHHYPFTLWDCAAAIVAHETSSGRKMSTLSCAQELIAAHYRNEVGGVMLSKTAHQMAHAGQLFVSLKQVFGDVNAFVERYRLGVNDEMAEGLNKLVDLSEKLAPQGGCLRVEQTSWNLMESQTLRLEDVR
jgi:hypothetical protein